MVNFKKTKDSVHVTKTLTRSISHTSPKSFRETHTAIIREENSVRDVEWASKPYKRGKYLRPWWVHFTPTDRTGHETDEVTTELGDRWRKFEDLRRVICKGWRVGSLLLPINTDFDWPAQGVDNRTDCILFYVPRRRRVGSASHQSASDWFSFSSPSRTDKKGVLLDFRQRDVALFYSDHHGTGCSIHSDTYVSSRPATTFWGSR